MVFEMGKKNSLTFLLVYGTTSPGINLFSAVKSGKGELYNEIYKSRA